MLDRLGSYDRWVVGKGRGRVKDRATPALQRPKAAAAGPILHDDFAEFRRELYRCRRYRRPLALLGLSLETTDREELEARLRVLDRTWSDGSQLYVLLPETGREAADATVARLAAAERSVLDLAAVRIAAFPDDALTCGALLAAVSLSREELHKTDDRRDFAPMRRSRVARWFDQPAHPVRAEASPTLPRGYARRGLAALNTARPTDL